MGDWSTVGSLGALLRFARYGYSETVRLALLSCATDARMRKITTQVLMMGASYLPTMIMMMRRIYWHSTVPVRISLQS